MDYMLDRLGIMKTRLEDIDSQLSKITDWNQAKDLNKERAGLEAPVIIYNEYLKTSKDYDDAKTMSKDADPDMAQMGKEEVLKLEAEKARLYKSLYDILVPKDANDEKNIVMEIRGAVGGDEANIFAGDLYRMYVKYAEDRKWKIQTIEESPTSLGGYSQVSFMIKGKGVYSRLKFESGAHRVQRVPVTEKSGRIQTSTATVLVMPETKIEDVQINPNDLSVDTYRSSGAGGQNVNKTESAIRITHIPSGIIVTCQVERSQMQNREIAMELLRARLKAKIDEERNAKIGAERKLKVGTGERSEKIRTYNYPQNRVTDHRIGFTTNNLDRVMEGDLDAILDALQEEYQKDLILNAGKRND